MRLPTGAALKAPDKKWMKLVLYGITIYLLTLIILFPAHVAWQFVPQTALKNIRIQHLEGTIWDGRAGSLNVSGTDLGTIHWELHPLSFLFAQLDLSARLNSTNKQLQGRLALSSDSISAESFSGHLRAEELNPFTVPVSLQGSMQLNIQSLNYQPGTLLHINGELNWQNAAVDMVQTVALGDVQVTIQPDKDGIILKVKNQKSPLAVDGNINLSSNGQYRTNLGLYNREQGNTDIDNIIRMMGRPDATGRVYLRQQGKIPL